MITCDFCHNPVAGEIEYKDGEVIQGCADCLLEIVADSYKPVDTIREYTKLELEEMNASGQSSTETSTR